MEDYISEAEALSDIYDGFECSFESYTKSERRDYIDANISLPPVLPKLQQNAWPRNTMPNFGRLNLRSHIPQQTLIGAMISPAHP